MLPGGITLVQKDGNLIAERQNDKQPRSMDWRARWSAMLSSESPRAGSRNSTLSASGTAPS